jgi:hypothetical protein
MVPRRNLWGVFVGEHLNGAFSEELPGNECSQDPSNACAALSSVAPLRHSLPGNA